MNKILKITLGFACFFMHVTLNAQIEISKETEKKKKVEKPKKEIDNGTEIFFISNWSSTNRKLQENQKKDGLYGKPLGERANENKLNIWSFGIGMRNRIGTYLSWEGGLSYMRNGESYLFEGVDTSYQYQTTYSYICMPVKIMYTYGDKVKLLAGGGVVPQMFLKYRQDREWTTALNATEKKTEKTSSGYNSFVVSAVLNIGVQLNMGKRTSLLFMPEYRFQLSSSYEKIDPYVHFGRAIGFNMGLTYQL